MTVTQTVGRPGVPTSMPGKPEMHLTLLADGINRLNQGHANCTLTVTLDPGETQTVVKDSRISKQTCCIFHPQTADAAAALATTYAVCTSGSATIYHTSSASTDRTYTMGIIG